MVQKAPRLVLLRHGQSQWNLENRFTGWFDVGLTKKGAEEATAAGDLLMSSGVKPDIVHTSLQTRAILTANLALSACEQLWIPVHRSWRLNERHYGGLTGLNKQETVDLHGEERVREWRRSYSIAPPPMASDHPYNPNADVRYQSVPADLLPKTECLADVVERLIPYWEKQLASDLREFQTVLVAAHGNSLRALVKHLEGIPENEITELEIPTGAPIVYELNSDLSPTKSMPISERYLA
ncbi:MAG TPA: 2,3-diphosphoglycerate-dependent phosphoglycerate mutase [Acidimicrobiaceae bacterium]|nr:2,3-diphosphoglycerate-dependent phosphoglycerate mutase [Acidimicrobiaceae bacterium]|tara:strand:+ start:257 stop:973 length:717 start_codon:yes stop_codon:yes gene_type:complete